MDFINHNVCPVCADYDNFINIVCYDGETGKSIPTNYCPNCGAKMDLKEVEDES